MILKVFDVAPFGGLHALKLVTEDGPIKDNYLTTSPLMKREKSK